MGFNPLKTLKLVWNKKENDWHIYYLSKPTGHLVSGLISGYTSFKDFLKELEDRGYDLTTFKMTCDRKPEMYIRKDD